MLAGSLLLVPARARADAPPAARSPAAIAPLFPQYASRADDLVPPRLQYPTYVYIPGTVDPGMPGAPAKLTWYGWQTLLVLTSTTTVGLALGFGGAAAESPGAAVAGMSIGGAGLLLGGPIVHWAHGHTARGFGVLGLHFGISVAGAGLGLGVACAAGGCGPRSAGFGLFFGPVIGGSLGLIASLIVDMSAFSSEPVTEGATASRRAPGWTIFPDLKITREKTTLGFVGVF